MKSNLSKMAQGCFISVASFALAAYMTACSGSDDKSVAGGTSDDAGIIANLDVAGLSQKGPFVKGSAVTVQGIDCKTLELTDELFEGEVKSDKGDFAIDSVTLSASCALFEVTGEYRSEITGKKSSKEITLHALTDLKNRKNVNINVLTELEYERLMYLVTEKGKKFAEAKEQAEKEVLAAFNIAGSFEEFENLNIFEAGDENAALLAVSVMMQAETDDAGLAKRVEKFADSFAETGKWKDDKTKVAIEEWQVAATADGTLDSIRKNIESWGYADVVPAFEKYIEAFGDTVILSSSSKDVEPAETSSSSAKAKAGSEYDATANTLKDLRDDKVYKTVKIGDQVWMAENLNFETAASSCYNDSSKYCDKYGRLYTWAAAVGKSEEECGLGKECNLSSGNVRGVCPDGWYLPSEADYATLIEAVGGEKGAGTKLKSTSGWNDDDDESGNGTDAFGFSALAAGISNAGYYGVGYTTSFWGSTECGSEGVPETGNGSAYAMWLDYDDVNVNLRSYDAKDLGYSVRCVKDDGTVPESSSSEVSSPSSSSIALAVPCKTETEDNCEYGTLTDDRDGQTYKTVKIGKQWWMAENLNYASLQPSDSLGSTSFCYNDSLKYCEKYGRLYFWSAAMDSAATWSENGKGCGYGVVCTPTFPVRGVCPAGWHIPNRDELYELVLAVGGENDAGDALNASSTLYEQNPYGFSFLPSGRKRIVWFDNDDGEYIYDDDGEYGYIWSLTDDYWNSDESFTKYHDANELVVVLSVSKAGKVGLHGSPKTSGYPVRCLKD
ncbi:FISUMP domain-containing protein [Fibrobacter sp.]|uniref:FISUMP domain-containing protein n=1 Tax=Fibrobacter sp. TaxID=35828 RepID=UPI002639E0E8|nr:FISUMP domain-containing protein [Fibrobacter sp.]MDD5943953.1 FISUMP domain-containing protein [Fibrobacter sp.]